jgi:hypothetical protein
MNDRKPPRRGPTGGAAGEIKAPRLGRDIQKRIGDKLRAVYDDVVSEGVPDRFATLLRQLDDSPVKKEE